MSARAPINDLNCLLFLQPLFIDHVPPLITTVFYFSRKRLSTIEITLNDFPKDRVHIYSFVIHLPMSHNVSSTNENELNIKPDAVPLVSIVSSIKIESVHAV